MKKYRHLIAALISQSIGYFTPLMAYSAIKNLTKTKAILQEIDLLIHHKSKKIASRSVKEILKERGVDVSDLEKII